MAESGDVYKRQAYSLQTLRDTVNGQRIILKRRTTIWRRQEENSQLSGAMKNVIALGVGISTGLGYGDTFLRVGIVL